MLAAVPGSLAAGPHRGRISSLCSTSNCSDGDLGQLPSLSWHGNESRRLKDKWLIKKQCCIAGFFIPPTAASAEAAPLALTLPSPGEGAVRQLGLVPKLIMCLITCPSCQTAHPQPLAREAGWQRWARAVGRPGFSAWEALGREGCTGAGLSQGRCPRHRGGRMAQPGLSGCQPAVWGSAMLQAVLGGLSKHFLLRSHLHFFIWYFSFTSFQRSCLTPYSGARLVPAPCNPLRACSPLGFLPLSVISFNFLIALSVFAAIFASRSLLIPHSLPLATPYLLGWQTSPE